MKVESSLDQSRQHAFSAPRVILVHGHDVQCATYWDERDDRLAQNDDGPTHLIIGRFAPEEKVAALARRQGFTLCALLAFRDVPSGEDGHV